MLNSTQIPSQLTKTSTPLLLKFVKFIIENKMDPNPRWAMDTKQSYVEILTKTNNLIKKMHEEEKARIIERCREQFRAENSDKQWSDEEIDERCESIHEVNEMFTVLSNATAIDTTNVTIDQTDMEANDADLDTNDENENGENTSTNPRTPRSRPPKRNRRQIDHSYRMPHTRANMEWLAKHASGANRYQLR